MCEDLAQELALARDEIELLREDRDAWKEINEINCGSLHTAIARAERAEAKVARLEGELATSEDADSANVSAKLAHGVARIWIEAPGEVSWLCYCGTHNKHLRIPHGSWLVPMCVDDGRDHTLKGEAT